MNPPPLPDWPYAQAIAHRGGGRFAPENTVAALRCGWGFGFRMFEFDVKLSRDGVVLLMHDDRLERTTDGAGTVATQAWPTIRALDAGSWHGYPVPGERVPSLAQAADWLIEHQAQANIEIKPCAGRAAETGVAVALCATECWAGVLVPPLLSSFSVPALVAARQSAPDLPRALLFDERLPEDWLAQASALECVSVHLPVAKVSRSRVQQAHQAGLRVLCYTLNDPVVLTRFRRWGLDGFFTDALDELGPQGA